MWETIVNVHDFYSLNLWRILSGGLGWSSHTVRAVQTMTYLITLTFMLPKGLRVNSPRGEIDPWPLRAKGLIVHPTSQTEKAIIKLANAS